MFSLTKTNLFSFINKPRPHQPQVYDKRGQTPFVIKEKPLACFTLMADFVMAGVLGLEPRSTVLETAALPIELYPYGAENEIRTRDPLLGKEVLYH